MNVFIPGCVLLESCSFGVSFILNMGYRTFRGLSVLDPCGFEVLLLKVSGVFSALPYNIILPVAISRMMHACLPYVTIFSCAGVPQYET